MKNKAYLLIDFGSTYTKLTLVDIDQEVIIATSKAMTTVEEDIMTGFQIAFDQLSQQYDPSKFEIIKKLACSSAAGGLKMVTFGLVPELTSEAGKRAALGAGARVLKTYSYEVMRTEINEIKQMNVDIILLSGGTDGGNKDVIIANAKKIAKHFKDIPIIVAGNKIATDDIYDIFEENGIEAIFTENVMPRLNEINVLPVREEIRTVFMKNIIQSKGMDHAESFIDGILMPTPAAVLRASEILSRGTDQLDGMGDLIVIDIGGATTDIHSLADGFPSRAGVNMRGLKEPYAKRTVEGDLGMRYSALSLFEASSTKDIARYFDDSMTVNVLEACQKRHDHVNFIPSSDEDITVDEALAKIATKLAMERHAGHVEVIYTPLGEGINQFGKDLIDVGIVIGTGGVLVHSKQPQAIIKEGLYSSEDPVCLKPKNPEISVDDHYILSAMGLLSFDLPDCAFRMMKKYILKK